jgi:hypothetical protein
MTDAKTINSVIEYTDKINFDMRLLSSSRQQQLQQHDNK